MSEFPLDRPEEAPLPIPAAGEIVYVPEGNESYPWEVVGTRTINDVLHVVVWRKPVASLLPFGDRSKFLTLEDYWKHTQAHSAEDAAIEGLKRSLEEE